MTVLERVGTETLMLLLAGFVIFFLVGVGGLQLYLTGDTGAFFRNVGIATLLLVFSVAFYRKWHREEATQS